MERKITWLRGAICDEGDGCEGAARLAGRAGLYLVSTAVTDPELLAAFAGRIGEGEVLTHVTDALFPELGSAC